MKRIIKILVIVTVISALFVLPAGAQGTSRSYILMANGNSLPKGLEAKVTAAGGTVDRYISQLGMVVVSSSNPNFSAKAAKISGISDVLSNVKLQWVPPMESYSVSMDTGNPPSSGNDDVRFDLQWGMDAIDAPEAWDAGYLGDGVRVAVLDAGMDATHPDLAPNVNTTLSASFVPGEDWQVQPGFYFNHGTHVAGIIAAADNAFGVIGVAPEAELVAVKVLSEYTGSGDFDWVIQGIVYAADIDADVINMSLGAVLAKNGYLDDNGTADPGDDFWVGANEVAALRKALSRATTYAYQNGTTVIASAGNEAIDRDHDAATTVLPADADHVIQISATAPIGWATDPGNIFLDNLASYSNYGQSAIDFGAPGGDFVYPGNENCLVAGLVRPCWVFDMVFSDIPGGFAWAAGTSMAAPHASGVAALIIGKNGGDMKPSQVETALSHSADDLGKPGNDDAYGAGRVNAHNVVK